MSAHFQRTSNGFGALHLAVLSVAARFFDQSSWQDDLVNPDEASHGEQYPIANPKLIIAPASVLELNHTLLAYLCTTSKGLKSGQGHPVLVTGVARSGGNKSDFIATAPSLPMVVELLADVTDQLAELSGEYEDVLEELQNRVDLSEERLAVCRYQSCPSASNRSKLACRVSGQGANLTIRNSVLPICTSKVKISRVSYPLS